MLSSLPPFTSTFITTLEIEANLSLSLQKSKHFSPCINTEATKQHLSQRHGSTTLPLALLVLLFSPWLLTWNIPHFSGTSIQLASGLLSAPFFLSVEAFRSEEAQSPPGRLPASTRKHRAELELHTVQWEPPKQVSIPHFSFFLPIPIF